MKVLHILLDEIIFDARVKKEIFSINSESPHKVELAYFGSKKHNLTFSYYDTLIKEKKGNRFLNKIPFYSRTKKIINISIQIFNILRNKKFDLIHVHNIEGYVIVLCVRLFTLNKKTYLVYDTHELVSGLKYKNKYWEMWNKLLDAFVIKKADMTIHANESRMIYSVDRFKLEPLKNMYVNNYYDIRNITSNSKISLLDEIKKKGKKIIIYQGVVCSDRLIFEIVKNFDKGCNKKVLLIIGDGSELNRIRKYIENNNLSHKIILLGQVSHEKLKNYTAYGDLGIVSYANICLNNYYCAPNKISEYVSSNVPILGIDLPEISKAINKYDIGTVFREKDLNNFGNIIDKTLLKYPNGVNSNTYDQFFKDINWQNESRKIIELYDKVENNIL